ncbi:MAG: hypothetical protein RSB72_00210 [Bacilli bacterium]
MKKLFFVLVLFFSGYYLVDAKTFYSDFSDYSEFSEGFVKESDTVKVISERRYKWYSKNKVLGGYYPILTTVPGFDLVLNSDSYETEFSNWSNDYPGFKFYRTIETRDGYSYKDQRKTRYIRFHDLRGSKGFLYISELAVVIDGVYVNYDVFYGGNDLDTKKINDLNYDDRTNGVKNGDGFMIDLKQYVNASDIVLKLYLYDEGISAKNINAYFTHDRSFISDRLAELNIINYFTSKADDKISPIIYTGKDYIYRSFYDESIFTMEYPMEMPGRVINKVSQYRYKDTLFRYYRLDSLYELGYFKENPGNFIRDDSQFKDFYSYKKRDKFVLSKDLLITSYDQNLRDFIVSTTVPTVKIDSDLNIHKNGFYVVDYILPFKTVSTVVCVNILQNDINELHDKLRDVNELLVAKKMELAKIKIDATDLKSDFNAVLKNNPNISLEIIKNYEDKISALKNNINSLIEDIDGLNRNRHSYVKKLKSFKKIKDEKVLKINTSNTTFHQGYLRTWLLIIFIILICLFGLRYIFSKKMSH